jgi:hypothetical protein
MSFWRAVVKGSIVAAIGPLVMAGRSLGEWWIGDLPLLLLCSSATALAVSLCRHLFLPTIERERGIAVDMILVGALSLPFLLANEVNALWPGQHSLRIRETLALTAVIVILLLHRVLRASRPPRRSLSVAVIAASLLAITAAVQVAGAEARVRSALSSGALARELRSWNADSAVATLDLSVRPDVYLFILDSYAGDSLLTAEFGVQHGALRGTLDSLGFAKAESYRSNYARTFASVASLLNFAQVASVSGEPVARTQHAGYMHSLISDNRTVRLFQAAGYDIHWYPAPFFAGRALPPRHVEVHRPRVSALRQYWLYSFLATSWFQSVWAPGVVLTNLGYRLDPGITDSAALHDLPRIVTDPRPTLAVVHLFGTHDPLMFDTGCQRRADAERSQGHRGAYASAVRCMDVALLQVWRTILTRSTGPVIIAAVGDHAPTVVPKYPSRQLAKGSDSSAYRFDAGAFFYATPILPWSFAAPSSGVEVVPAILRAAFGARMDSLAPIRFQSRSRPFPIHEFVPIP